MGHLQAAGAGQLVTVIQLRTLPFLSSEGEISCQAGSGGTFWVRIINILR